MTATGRIDKLELTASQEDYLETIYHVVEDRHAVRPKDIIDRMHVRGASVTGALRALAERGLVHYTPYDLVTLTPEGTAAARDVIRRHEVLREFLIRILGIAPDKAEEAACRMEHSVSRLILKRLAQLLHFVAGCPRAQSTPADEVLRQGAPVPECTGCSNPFPDALRPGGTPKADSPARELTLRDLKPGERAVVKRMRVRSAALRRIAEMGVTVGTPIEIERIAPLGDPMDVRVKGYHLSLRKADAEGIAVERLKEETS